jgi:UDP-GlcNAc:undecaprenyl-phosphate GlcNAc-1-phosphate transferase
VPEPLDTLVSVFWLVAVTNAFNIIDVHDGLCAGVGAVATTFFGAFALLQGDPMVAVICAALLGSLLGFLRYNFPPATIYLGDTGSMLIGLLLGALAMVGQYSTSNSLAPLFAPLAVLSVPLFDIGFVVVARLRHRLPVYHGSPDHFAVRLRHAGVSARRISLAAYGAGAVMGGLGLLASRTSPSGAIAVLGGMAALVVIAFAYLWRLDPRRTRALATATGAAAMTSSQPPAPPAG